MRNDFAFAGTFVGDIATEFSDVVLAQTLQMNEVMNLSIGNETCQASATGFWETVGTVLSMPSVFPCLSTESILAMLRMFLAMRCPELVLVRSQLRMTAAGWEFEDEHLGRLR